MAKPSESPEWSENITLQCKTFLDLPPSCLEFVPKPSEAANASPHLDEYYHEYFVVGTYYLEKEKINQMDSGDVEQEEEKSTTASKPQSKNGSLILFRYHDGNLRIVQTLPHPSAVFDLHFIPGLPVFAIVSSTGTVAIFKLAEKQHVRKSNPVESDMLHIETIGSLQVFPKDVAPTYFTWAPNSRHAMAVTTSDGGVYLVRFSLNYDGFQILNNEEPVIMHSEYAWCSSFSSAGDRLYSGGDDNKLRLEDLGNILSVLNSEEELETSELFPEGIPGHDAGVTFILPLPSPKSDGQLEILLTGSYDDHIRIISIPAYPSRPKVLTELHLGGGVWRIKIINYARSDLGAALQYTVLASCMHAGARVLLIIGTRNSSDEAAEWAWEISVLAEMRLHKSMNYASDVQPIASDGNEGDKRVFVSSSFYDRLLCVWTWDPVDGA